MTRKLITTLLCLVLAVALPLAALADTRHTLTLIPGDDLSAVPAIADLCDALSLTLTKGEKSGGLTLSVGGEDIATVALGADSTGLYAQSTLLGDDVYYVNWDDGFAYVSDLVMEIAEANGMETDEGMAATLKNTLDLYKTKIVETLGAAGYAGSSTVTGTLDSAMNDREALKELIQESFPDDPDMVAVYERLFDNMTLEEGEFTDPERDPATRHMSMVLTSEDMADMCDTQYMRGVMEMTLKSQNPELGEEELSAAVDEAIEQARSVYEESDLQLVMNIYTSDEDTKLVGMDMGMEMTIPADEGTETKAALNFNYDRLTGNNGVDHRADMSMIADDETLGLMGFQLSQGKDGVSDGYFAVLANRQQVTFAYHAENQGNDRIRTLNLYSRGNAAAIIAPAASDRPLFGFQLVSGPAEDSVLDAIDNATGDTAIDLMKLSAEEMQSLFIDLQAHVTQAAFTALGNLPESVIQLMTSGTPTIEIEE